MRLFLGCCLTLLCVSCAARAESTQELRVRLNRAEIETSLYAPTLKPWHLKVAFNLYDDKGANPAAGEFEEWWAAPGRYRITFTSPALKGTSLHKADGNFHTAGMAAEPASIEALYQAIVDPMPDQRQLDEATPDLTKVPFGNVKLDCITQTRRLAHAALPPFGLFPTYCFSPGTDDLRFMQKYVTQSVLRNGMGRFQGQSVSTQVKVSDGTLNLADGKVVTLETLPAASVDLSSAGLEKSAPVQAVEGSVIAKNLLHKVAPYYPQSAKDGHTSGDVLLHVVVGTDGVVRDLEVLEAPSADLAIAAVDAVRRWVYKPYLLNGDPVKIATTVTVQFRFS